MIQTMFLCAGLGTRLLPLTRELPKPMVPLGDRPMLGHLLDALEAAGGRPRAVNTHHLPEEISSYISSYNSSIHISHEDELLGTAGGVFSARDAFERAPLVVWNADILTRPRISALIHALECAPLVLSVELLAAGQGNVGLDADGRIVRLRQRSIGKEVSGGAYVGILALGADAVDVLPTRGCLIGDVAIPWMEQGARIVGIAHDSPWSDVGSLRAYVDENIRWLRQGGHGAHWIGPAATVASTVELRSVVVGAGATIGGTGLLERVIVWPHAHCAAPLANAVVTPEAGIVHLGLG